MTTTSNALDADDLTDLLGSWLLALRAERKSDRTITSYRLGVEQYLRYCADHDIAPALDRRSLAAFTTSILDSGKATSTAVLRQLAVRLFSAWLAAEGEIPRDELVGVKPPKLEQRVVDSITDDELSALVEVCQGKRFVDRRDEAIVRFLAETGCRAGELLALRLGDLDVAGGKALVNGKGRRERWVVFQAQTGRALDRYLRMRRRQPNADSPLAFVGDRGMSFSHAALLKMMKVRGAAAGVDNLHPHRLRHTFASRALRAGMSEGGVMTLAGWRRREMLDRYVQDTAADRAAAEVRSLNLGDI